MDLLLTHAYFLHEDKAELRIMRPYVPLGILCLAGYMEQQGFAVEVFDSTFESLDSFGAYCDRHKPIVIGISANLMTRGNAVRMIRIAREHGCRTVLGGPEPALYADEFLAHGADVVVIGEGEQTLCEVVRMMQHPNPSYETIDGIAYREATGTVRRTKPRVLMPDIDILPPPARDKVDLQRYLDVWKTHHGYSSLSVVTMRGCPFTCTWCSHGVYGETYRRRSPAVVVEELETLIHKYAPDRIWFADDVFSINKKWMLEFQREVSARRLALSYECITRSDRMDEDIVRALKSTGCQRVWIGSESGSQRVLDKMSRRTTVEQITRATRLAQEAGIEVGYFLMLGYDGETREDIEETVRHVRNARPDLVLTTVAYPIKGTRFYSSLEGRMTVPAHPFAEWNDRMIEVSGRYSRRFYWFANRRLVNEALVSRAGGEPRLHRLTVTPAFIKAKIAQFAMYFLS